MEFPSRPSWGAIHPGAMPIIRRTLAMAVLEADETCTKVKTWMQEAEERGDKAAQAAGTLHVLIAQTDLVGRAMLFMSTFQPEDTEGIDTIAGVLLRAELTLVD